MTGQQSIKIEELLEADWDPTAWEIDFMNTMENLCDADGELSDDQDAKLTEIWNKVFS